MSFRMIKMLFILMLSLVLALCPVLAGAAEGLQGGEVISPAEADLDGDGELETVTVMDVLNEDGEAYMGLEVKKGTLRVRVQTDIVTQEKLYLCDMDGDGLPEILFSGDECSDDYITYCWRFRDGKLVTVPFEEGDVLDGGVLEITPGRIKVFATVNALGTYTGYRELVFADGKLQFEGNSWTIGSEEFAYTPMLIVKEDIYVVAGMNDEGDFGEETILEAGTVIYLTETDGRTTVEYITEGGSRGVILLEEDEWGSHTYVNGMPEEDVFEGIEYAD